jgi:YidC/Oxa1 family membrane protein insertase
MTRSEPSCSSSSSIYTSSTALIPWAAACPLCCRCGAQWLWVKDLSQAETLAIHILPLVLVAVQFLTQKMTPAPGMDPAQQKMMMFMPLVFGYMFYFASAGLALYWLTSGLAGLAQQWILNRVSPAPSPAGASPAVKKKK